MTTRRQRQIAQRRRKRKKVQRRRKREKFIRQVANRLLGVPTTVQMYGGMRSGGVPTLLNDAAYCGVYYGIQR